MPWMAKELFVLVSSVRSPGPWTVVYDACTFWWLSIWFGRWKPGSNSKTMVNFNQQPWIFSMHSTEFYVRTIVFIHLVKASSPRWLKSTQTVWLSIFITLMLRYAVTHVAVKSLLLLLSVSIIHVLPQPISARHILLTQLLIIIVVITAFHFLREIRPLPSGPCRTKFRYALS